MKKSILLAALFCAIIVLTACSQPGEITVEKYFQAMKLNDKDTMSSMALEPKDLEFKSFEIGLVGEPIEKDLELPIYEKKLKELNKQKAEQGNNAMDAQDNLEELKDELSDARGARTKAGIQKQIEEAEKAFAEEKQQYNFLLMNVADLQKKISREKDMIRMSTGRTESLNLFSGKSFYQKVDAKVILENGDVNNYVFLLKRTDLTLQEQEKTLNGRLIIIKIQTAAEYEKELQETEAEAEAEAAADQQPPAEEKTEEVNEEKTAEEKGE
jgi:hypothetical protein